MIATRSPRRPGPGLPVLVEPADKIADLRAGTYTVTETTPPDVGGTWSLDSVTVPARRREGGSRRRARSRSSWSSGTVCTFYNRFTPAGRITLRKITLGGTGTTRFQVRPGVRRARPEHEQVATTTERAWPSRRRATT